jgi:A/G-specific adenine glycosylase
MKKAAQQIMTLHHGQFPHAHKEVLALPGVGEYTAGAICSIAFNRPTPAVDGNVLRVIARITDDDTPIDLPQYKKSVQQNLQEIYPAQAGDFTQALMELGATVCGPNRRPDCKNCPCKTFCLGQGRAEALPVRLPKAGRRTEEKTVFVLSCDGAYALRKRPNKGLLAGLWEFPNVPGKLDTTTALKQVEKFGLKPKEITMQVERKHIFTHIEWDMCGIYIEVATQDGEFTWLSLAEIAAGAALPTAFRQFVPTEISEKM